MRGAFVKFDRVSLHLLAVDFDRDCNSIQNQLLKFYYLAIGVREVADSNPVVPTIKKGSPIFRRKAFQFLWQSHPP